jgi:hypothetical protein
MTSYQAHVSVTAVKVSRKCAKGCFFLLQRGENREESTRQNKKQKAKRDKLASRSMSTAVNEALHSSP